MSLIRTALAIILVAFAVWPALTAGRLFLKVVLPALKTGADPHFHDTLVIGGLQLTGWQMCAVPAAFAMVALLMIGVGLYLAFAKSEST